jgi:tetratricopeptide (TPR) repeat protein
MEQYELIENYLSNALTPEQKQAFELQLQNDAQLAEEVAIYKAINGTMQTNVVSNEVAFKENLQPLQNEYFGNTALQKNDVVKTKGKVRMMIFAALSAAAILVVVFTLVPMGSSKKSAETLYAEYAIHENVENITRGSETKTTLQLAIDLYNVRNYTAAIPIFEKVKDSSAEAMLLLGISYMQTNNFTNAHSCFDNILKGKSIFIEKAIWNKALAYLKNKDLANCKVQLNKLLLSETYKKNANTILKNL